MAPVFEQQLKKSKRYDKNLCSPFFLEDLLLVLDKKAMVIYFRM